MEEKDKKKILIGSIILVITLILVVIGTTYAFFALEIKGSETSTSIHLTAGNANQIVLDGGIEGFHINVNASDMAYNNKGTEYFATDGEGNYVKTKEEGTKTIGTITINGNLEEKHKCTASVNIVTSGTMQGSLQKGDLILVLIQGEKEQEIDLTEIGNPTIEFDLQGTTSQTIKAYLKLTNRDAEQKDIAGKTLNVTINIQDLKCEVEKTNVELLQEKGGDTFKEQSGMYRFIGTNEDVTHNYICFGTDNTETCKGNPNEFMYRIIGVTSSDDAKLGLHANQLKLIKAVPSSESQQWHNVADDTKWDASAMKTYLNETFLGAVQWEKPGYWKGLITSQKWYNADQPSVPTVSAEPTDSTTAESKIGLIYATDYTNAGPNGYGVGKNNWLYIENGWSTNSSLGGDALYEWTLSRLVCEEDMSYCRAWSVDSSPSLWAGSLALGYSVRPVFYVDPNITLTGEGTVENPYIIHY